MIMYYSYDVFMQPVSPRIVNCSIAVLHCKNALEVYLGVGVRHNKVLSLQDKYMVMH